MKNEKRQIQLKLVTKLMEKVFLNLGFEKDFSLKKISIPIEIQKKYASMILLYEKIIKTSTIDEIKSQSNFEMMFFGLANYYYNSNEYSKSLEKLDFLLTQDLNDVNILFSKGILLELLKLPEKAIECYESVLQIKPIHVYAAYNKSVLDARLGKYEKAIESLDKVISIEPKHIFALCDKGILLLETNHPRDAITCFNEVLDVNPKHLSALYNKGVALELLSRFDEALECYQSIIYQDPQYDDAILQAGKILSSLEKDDEAIKIYDLGLKSNPHNVSVLYYKSKSLLKQGKDKDIPKLLNHILSLDARYIELVENEIDFTKYLKPLPTYEK